MSSGGREGVLQSAPLYYFNFNDDLVLQAEAGSTLGIDQFQFYCNHPSQPRTEPGLNNYFKRTSGRLSLVKLSQIGAVDSDLREVGASFKSLESLDIRMMSAVLADSRSVFNKEYFPKLKYFRDLSIPPRNDPTREEILQKTILHNARNGTFSVNFREFRIGISSYILKIHRCKTWDDVYRPIECESEEGTRESWAEPKTELDQSLEEEFGLVVEEVFIENGGWIF
ncbi:hypothetical protein TWF696_000406 [Orbilia brochopaga]|uniref:Uncharacterized protein n=1 Tax=Orbilia brochopaga TaxID=3140254 RepID=A0AAV9VER6_9PEZI